MSIASRITAITGHITDIYDTLELGGDTTENKNIVNINTEIKREYKNFLAHGVDVLWNNWEKVSGSGETLTLNNTMEGKMKVDLKGNTQQNGTPTPDTPIDIQVVSGDNTIKVEGKNLLGIEFTNSYSGRGFIFEDSIMTYYGNGNLLYTSDKYNINIQSGNNVTMSLEYDSGTLNSGLIIFRINFYNSNDTLITNLSTGDVGTSAYKTKIIKTKTLNQNVSYIKVYVQSYQANLTGDLKFKCQLELNNQATTYTPYVSQTYPISLGNIELCKIGTYQDSIVKDNGKWYLKKQIGKVVLDGSESWYARIGTKYNCQITNNLPSNKGTGTDFTGYSNYYIAGGNWDYSGDKTILVYKNSAWNYANIQITDSSFATAQELQNWLNTHNTELYYPLANPTYEEITDATLINQLEALAYSYEGTTNISQENDDLASELDVVALQEM